MLCVQFILYLFAIVYYTESLLPQSHELGNQNQNKSNFVGGNLNQIAVVNLTKSRYNAEFIRIPPSPNRSATNNTQDNKTISSLSSNKSQHPNVEVYPGADGNLEEKTLEFEPGAITRGILVLVGVSFLFILYVGFMTYKKKKRDKRRTLVRKYGVRTRKSDLEMEPLPLSDDEEDETLFDLTVNGSSHLK